VHWWALLWELRFRVGTGFSPDCRYSDWGTTSGANPDARHAGRLVRTITSGGLAPRRGRKQQRKDCTRP
jgi:hypothetical protein